MAFENLFIRTKKSIAGIQFDAVVNEIHDGEIILTKNPVELGADVTDHAIIQPKTLEMNVVISDNPLGLAAFGVIIDNISGLFGTSTSENQTRSVSAYNALVQLAEKREPIEIQTGLKLYTNMVLTRHNVIRDKDTSRIAAIRLIAQEVLIVETKIVELSASQLQLGSARQQGTSPINGGRRENTTPSSSTQTSVLKSVTNWISGN